MSDLKSRGALIAGNWKMFKTCNEAIDTAQELVNLIKNFDNISNNIDIMIAPTFVSLFPVAKILENTNIALGAQDLFWEDEGAFTGAISGHMLKSVGCKYIIIGHSERRQCFNETNKTVNKKIKAALKNNLVPIMCIGESEKEREANKTFDILENQIKEGLEGLLFSDLEKLIIAYEPIWAIGTGKTATTQQAQEVHLFIRSLIEKVFGNNLAKNLKILYGGSVKADNIAKLMEMPDIDGALVGGASLNSNTFSKIIKF